MEPVKPLPSQSVMRAIVDHSLDALTKKQFVDKLYSFRRHGCTPEYMAFIGGILTRDDDTFLTEHVRSLTNKFLAIANGSETINLSYDVEEGLFTVAACGAQYPIEEKRLLKEYGSDELSDIRVRAAYTVGEEVHRCLMLGKESTFSSTCSEEELSILSSIRDVV